MMAHLQFAEKGSTMDIIEMLTRAQGGDAVKNLSRQFGLEENQTQAALEQLAPVIAAGLRRNTRNDEGLAGLVNALQRGNHDRYYDDPSALASPETIADGNGILGHIFGSKQVSRDVAAHAADTTGIGSGILKQMLPIIASILMGSMSKKTREPGLQDIIGDVLGGALGGRESSGNPGGGILGDVLGSILGGAQTPEPEDAPRSTTRERRSQTSLQDVFGDMLSDRSNGTAADDLLDSVLRHTRR